MSYIGILIGFYGYLFPGNINLMVVNLFQLKQYKYLSFVLLLILISESLYSIVTLLFLKTIIHQSIFYKGVEIFSLLLLAALGIWMIADRKKDNKTAETNTNKRGLLAIFIHPQQIPFWMAVATLFGNVIYNNIYWFILYNALGVLLIMLTYMLLGKLLIAYFKLNLRRINLLIGMVYIGIALYSIIKITIPI